MVDVGVHVKRIASDLRETLESKAELYSAMGTFQCRPETSGYGLRGTAIANGYEFASRQGCGPLHFGGLDVWSTLANVQRQGNQKDHVLAPRHCRVPRNEAVVARLGEANVRALADERNMGCISGTGESHRRGNPR